MNTKLRIYFKFGLNYNYKTLPVYQLIRGFEFMGRAHFPLMNYVSKSRFKEKGITGINDPFLIKQIEKGDPSYSFWTEDKSIYIGFAKGSENLMLQVNLDLFEAKQLIREFKSIVTEMNPTVAFGHEDTDLSILTQDIYRSAKRRPMQAGLYWINYLGGPEEMAIQGGDALLNNPFATSAERVGRGIFIQVGETPLDSSSPEGWQLLLNATAAMPPIKQ